MIKSFVTCCCLLAAMVPGVADAEETAPIARGTAGLVAVPVRARNAGPADMSCSVALAHWYSQDLGHAAPGASVEAGLWYDPSDGNVLLLNAHEDHMPVQTLWCGAGPSAWATRAVIRLERRVGTPPAAIDVTCGPEAQRLVCR